MAKKLGIDEASREEAFQRYTERQEEAAKQLSSAALAGSFQDFVTAR